MPSSANQTALGAQRKRRIATITTALLLTAAAVASAHDMFAKPARFFVDDNAELLVRVLNGTFSKSENSIARARVRDISVVAPDGRRQLDTAQWRAEGDTSAFRVTVGAAGTYVLGASTTPNVIALQAKDFNLYLREDGIPDVLEERRRPGELDRPARERYARAERALGHRGRRPRPASRAGYVVREVHQHAPCPGGHRGLRVEVGNSHLSGEKAEMARTRAPEVRLRRDERRTRGQHSAGSSGAGLSLVWLVRRDAQHVGSFDLHAATRGRRSWLGCHHAFWTALRRAVPAVDHRRRSEPGDVIAEGPEPTPGSGPSAGPTRSSIELDRPPTPRARAR